MTLLTPIRLAGLSALLLTACNQSSPPADAQNSPASTPASHTAPTLPKSFTALPITDPAFDNMTAGTITVPSGWKMQGIMMNPPCATNGPVFRAYSPDGLTEMRTMPPLGWTWYASGFKPPNAQSCMQMTKVLSAKEFIDHYLETIQGGVHVVGPMPVSPDISQHAQDLAAKLNAAGANFAPAVRAENTADTAAVRVETHNGTFLIEQRILAEVHCSLHNSGPFKGGTCYGVINVLRAPQGKLDAFAQYVDTNHLPKGQPSPQWIQAVTQRQQLQGQQAMEALKHQEQVESGMIRQQYEQFRETQQRNHDAFMQQQESSFRSHEASMAQQESSFHSSMNNANNAMNARSTAASDWVDYALDQQTVTGSGGTAKVSSSYSQTWSSTVGNQTQWYQTNDPNSNPNGALPGNWTQDTKVHGNGQPF